MEGATVGDSPRMAVPLSRDKTAYTQRSPSESSATSVPDSPLVLAKPADELALVQRTVENDQGRRETHLEEPRFRRKAADNRCYIPNGLSSQLFMPLWNAVFRHKKLQKKTVASADVERLCIALLCASKAEDRPFLTVGCHIKGLCIILSHKLEFLAEDCNQLSKKLLMSTAVLAIAARPKQRQSYREDDDYQLPKRKRQSAKTKKQKKQMLALEDYFETGHKARSDIYDEYSHRYSVRTEDGVDRENPERHDIAVDQIEVLQLMNFGIGLGMGTDLAFYSAGSSNVDRDISYHNFEHGLMDGHRPSLESLQQHRETIIPDTFLDLQSLSSPFKLNGYSYTPQTRFSQDASDADTTIASTELTLQSESVTLSTPDFGRYDLDWDIYNDPFQDEGHEQQSVSNESRTGAELVPANNRTRRMVLEYAEPSGKHVHLVKSRNVGRYDTKVTSRTPKAPRKVRITKEQNTLDTFAVTTQPICDKTQWFNSAIDSLVKSVMGCVPEAGDEAAQQPDAGTSEKQISVVQPVVKPPSTKQGEKWFKSVEREVSKTKRVQSPRHAFDSETVSTVQLIEGFRTCVRQRENASEPIQLDEVLQGRSKESAALLFYRTLVLANAQFVALSQPAVPGAPIAVTPARRFWEPIQTSRDLKA